MDPVERSVALGREGTRLLEVAAADPEVDIPSCPGWRAFELLGHVATGWEAFRIIVETASTEPPDFGTFADVPDDADGRVAFAEDRLARLVTAIAAVDPARPVWSWNGTVPLAFYPRRALQETLVHRHDAERGAGCPTPIDPQLGFDGVDELYSVLLSGTTDGLPGGSLHLHQTDGDGELMLTAADGGIRVTHEHGKGDAALRATGEDLLLTMWGRRGLDGLELFGDAAVVAQWIALAP